MRKHLISLIKRLKTITPGLTGPAVEAKLSASANGPGENPERLTAPAGRKRPAGWREKSHSKDVAPNYSVVFPKNAVNALTIAISPDNWAAMQADLVEFFFYVLAVREAIAAADSD